MKIKTIIAIATLLASASGGTAIARSQPGASQPAKTDEVSAVAVLDAVSVTIEDCEGADASYLEIDIVAEGPLTSEDPRLAGDFKAHIHGLIKQDGPNLKGPAVDSFEIRDSATGALKASGTRYSIVDGALPERGMAVATLADGSTLIGAVTVVPHGIAPAIVDHNLERQGLPATGVRGPIVYKFGGRTPAANPIDIALIQNGACD